MLQVLGRYLTSFQLSSCSSTSFWIVSQDQALHALAVCVPLENLSESVEPLSPREEQPYGHKPLCNLDTIIVRCYSGITPQHATQPFKDVINSHQAAWSLRETGGFASSSYERYAGRTLGCGNSALLSCAEGGFAVCGIGRLILRPYHT